MSIEPGRMLLHYRLTGPLGQGGMGEVWKATDTTLDRDVAIKLLPQALSADPERLARFEREAKLLAAMNHPNIAAVFGFHPAVDATEAGFPSFLVMELVPGEDLAERLARGPIPVDEALAIARQVGQALEAAHEQGIIHRDLKPANIRLCAPTGADEAPTVKVLDFGLAKALDPTTPAESATQLALSPTITSLGTTVGMILGTAGYMAPEQAKGAAVDRRADVWAFGVVLFEMLTARKLFQGDGASEVLASVIKDQPPWEDLPAHTPAAVRRLLRRCLAKHPGRRLRDIGDALLELDESQEAVVVAAPPAESPGRRLAWGVAALALVTAAAFGGLWWSGRPAVTTVAPLQASLPTPEGVTLNFFGDFGAPPTLSPDGTRIVFGGTDASGPRLWVREIADGQSHVLDKTTNGTFPFWSPDGERVGFFANGKLKVVNVEGGTATTLCDAPNGRGGSWNEDGTILFSPEYRADLYRVDVAGGEPVQVTQRTELHSTHRWPEFLPDGKSFLYLAAAHDNRDAEIRHAALDGSFDRHVQSGTRNAAFADGWLLFARDGALRAQRYDPETGETSGEAKTIVESVMDDASTWHSTFSTARSGDRLVFSRGATFVGTTLTWFDRTGKKLGTVGELQQHDTLSLSPDDKRLAVGIGTNIVVFDLERDSSSRLTFGEFIDDSPIWTPDGQTIYYEEYGRPDRSDRILRRPANGAGEPELVLEGVHPDDLTPFAISPDQRALVIGRGIRPFTISSELWMVPLDGGDPVALTQDGSTVSASFSPDGRWLAYVRTENSQSEVFVSPWDAPERRLGAGLWQISQNGGRAPEWSRDGEELLFVGRDQQLFSVTVDAADNGFRFSTPTALFRTTLAAVTAWDVARDGRFFIVSSLGDTSDRPVHIIAGWTALLDSGR